MRWITYSVDLLSLSARLAAAKLTICNTLLVLILLLLPSTARADCPDGIHPGCGCCYHDPESPLGGSQTCWDCSGGEHSQYCAFRPVPLPFDVVHNPNQPPEASWDDLNGLYRNPWWNWQVQHPRECPNAQNLCETHGSPLQWSCGALACTLSGVRYNTSGLCGYHANWFPVTYEGTVSWEGAYDFFDGDFNMYILSDVDRGLCTSDHSVDGKILMEFNSEETVDRYDRQPWWHSFKEVARGSPNPLGINGKQAIAIGLLGLDCAHSCGSELHPVYGLAIHWVPGTANDDWVFFIRNFGDEGACGTNDEPWNKTSVKLLLPPPSFPVLGASLSYSNVITGGGATWSTEFVPGRGLVLTADLPLPQSQGWIAGEVYVNWQVCHRATCAELGLSCGTTDDGCGGTLQCGTCSPPYGCVSGSCRCTPQCAGVECGSDGCFGSCGTCSYPRDCIGGRCLSCEDLGTCGCPCGGTWPGCAQCTCAPDQCGIWPDCRPCPNPCDPPCCPGSCGFGGICEQYCG